MPDLPIGTVTLLFTDIEGSTRLLQQLGPSDYGSLLAEHHRLLGETAARHDGIEVKTEGDSFFIVFPRAPSALEAVVAMQRGLAAAAWPGRASVRVRMGLHTGEVALSAGEYIGIDVHRAARISDAAHGGQVLMSEATRSVVQDSLPEGIALRDMGEHRLKDIDGSEHIFQLLIEGLPVDFPPIRAMSMRLDLLPRETTGFIGREAELARSRQLLAATRLLTLTGPGGTGKTRLGLQLARELSSDFTDGVAFVPLAPISDPSLVAPTIRQTLGLAEEPGRPAVATVAEGLRHRNLLLVLDNFEQVLDAAPTLAELLAGTEQLKILVTSRSRLHLSGEQEFGVPPLDTPRVEQAGDLAAVSQSEAVALFMQRARSSRPDFELTAANARAIVEICLRLDGLPLAIELAASRVKLLPPQALLARIERRLDILQSSSADGSDRQRTLRGTIDWSYDLLNTAEQALFRRLSVFVGGSTLESAEAVVGATGTPVGDLLEGLTSLVDHSLVRQEEHSGEPRFSMLETIREYGREQLEEAGELADVAAAHASHFATLVREAEPHLTGGPAWADRLELEHDNLRAMLRWAAGADLPLALHTAGALWRFWHLRGHLREGSGLLTDLLARPAAQAATAARAKALVGLAGLVYWMGDYGSARDAYEEALGIAGRERDESLAAEALYSLAYVHAIHQDWDQSVATYERARIAYEALGDKRLASYASMGIGMITTLRGDHEQAVPLLRQALASFEAGDEDFGRRNTLAIMTRALMQAGRLEEARQRNTETIRVSGQDPTGLSAALLDCASLDALEGKPPERAARLVGAAQAMVERAGGQAPPQLINRIDPMPLVRERLDEARLDQLIMEGRALSSEEAVELALEAQPS
ncbi:MAG TPA: adenylate/guanylate cyclase domain-containing protein [Candidatus Limnocylindria bacterium]|nr:adenylate/guanylate cyclase domain-containing protein [Candidatus Limnocylindria bacterium]